MIRKEEHYIKAVWHALHSPLLSDHLMKNCPNLFSTGLCNDQTCSFNHNILTCDVCSLVCRDINDYNQHLKTKKHRSRAAGITSHGLVYCPICKRSMPSEAWSSHKKGKKHAKEARSLGVSTEAKPETDIPSEIQSTHQFCPTCQIYVARYIWSQHASGRRHKRGQEYTAFKMAQSEAEKDKNDVAIQGDLNFSVVVPATAMAGVTKTIEIRSTAPLSKIDLKSAKLSADIGSSRPRRIASP